MRFHTKFLILLQFIIVFFFISQRSFAQYPGMGAVYRNIDRQLMYQQMNMQMMLHHGMSNTAISRQYNFNVIMKDGTKLSVHSKIFTDTTLHQDYLLYENKSLPKTDSNRNKKIFCYQTQNISRFIGSFSEKDSDRITGFSTDSCWRFKVEAGKINIYSYLSEINISEDFSPASFIGLQYNNGEIVEFSENNLKKMLSSDDKAMKKFLKNYYLAVLKFNKDAEKASK